MAWLAPEAMRANRRLVYYAMLIPMCPNRWDTVLRREYD